METLCHTDTWEPYQNDNSNGRNKYAVMDRKRKHAPTSLDTYEDEHRMSQPRRMKGKAIIV